MASILENSHELGPYVEKDVYALLVRLSHIETKRYMRVKHTHEELLTLLITLVVLLAVILFILIWKLC